MKSLTRLFSTLLVAGTVFASTSAFAATPFEIATQAYRGQLEGISGYRTLKQDLDSGKVSVEDVITAAGETPTPELRRSVGGFLSSFGNIN